MGDLMIYAAGRNYSAHAKELGNKPPPEPIIFFKPPASIVLSGETVDLPKFSTNVQYEVELALRLNEKIEISEICVANDLTARDKQREAQETKTPWCLAKGFKQSCGLGNWVSMKDLKKKGVDLRNLELKLIHNGQLAQHGFTQDMTFSCQEILDYLKERFPLVPGDIILTGTPEGVGPVVSGDEVIAEIVGLSRGHWKYK